MTTQRMPATRNPTLTRRAGMIRCPAAPRPSLEAGRGTICRERTTHPGLAGVSRLGLLQWLTKLHHHTLRTAAPRPILNREPSRMPRYWSFRNRHF